MQIVGVIDLLDGRAVHAVAGERALYRPLVPWIRQDINPGDTEALTRWYVEDLGLDALYVADLDAIEGRPSQQLIVSRICQHRASVFVDSGVSTPDAAQAVVAHGAASVIVGLETLSSFEALRAICDLVGSDRVTFSLDLKRGAPLASGIGAATPDAIAAQAADAGVRNLIVLDLARVGVGTGVDLDLIARVRAAIPRTVRLLAGGGVRGWRDLEQLAMIGCHGALVATALHDGRLSAQNVERAKEL